MFKVFGLTTFSFVISVRENLKCKSSNQKFGQRLGKFAFSFRLSLSGFASLRYTQFIINMI